MDPGPLRPGVPGAEAAAVSGGKADTAAAAEAAAVGPPMESMCGTLAQSHWNRLRHSMSFSPVDPPERAAAAVCPLEPVVSPGRAACSRIRISRIEPGAREGA